MVNFVVWLLATQEQVWSAVVEKGLFGRRYIRLGPVFLTLGGWCFQQGGALGYGLKGHAGILGKLLGAEAGREEETIRSFRDLAESHLKEAEYRDKNFFELYARSQLQGLGIDVTQLPLDKAINEQWSISQASDVMKIAIVSGAALGYHFPDTFKEYGEETYRLRPDNEWQKLRTMGVALADYQSERPLNDEVTLLAEFAVQWAEQVSQNVMENSEISVLKRLTEGTI